MLGPDFMTDIIEVETSDHARLNLKLAYRWHFNVDRGDNVQAQKLFKVRDFVGDVCKSLSSRIRGQISSKAFDNFHKNSTDIIQTAVHKKDEQGNLLPYHNKANDLFITQVDIQSIEPVDSGTRASLQKSVNLAFEI